MYTNSSFKRNHFKSLKDIVSWKYAEFLRSLKKVSLERLPFLFSEHLTFYFLFRTWNKVKETKEKTRISWKSRAFDARTTVEAHSIKGFAEGHKSKCSNVFASLSASRFPTATMTGEPMPFVSVLLQLLSFLSLLLIDIAGDLFLIFRSDEFLNFTQD